MRRVGFVPPVRPDETAAVQDSHRVLYGALRKAGVPGDCPVADPDLLLPVPRRPAPQIQVDKERSRTAVVPNQIAKQHIVERRKKPMLPL